MMIGYAEFKKKCRARLNAVQFINEDPCAALAYIYHGDLADTAFSMSVSDNDKRSEDENTDKTPPMKDADAGIRG